MWLKTDVCEGIVGVGSEERPIYFMWIGVSGVLSDVFAGSEIFIWYLGWSTGSSTLHGHG